MLLVDDLAAGGTKNLRHTPRGLVTLFISFLYFDLYVLGDDALISYGSFMQTKHLCVLIHI